MPPEAQTRDADPAPGGQAVDQSARAAALTVEVIPSAEDVVEDLRAQMDELDKRDKEKDAEIATARQRADTAERARQAAENRARDADRVARQATETAGRSVDEARLDSIKNALGTQQGQMANLKTQLAAANAEGDFTKAADLQGEMSILGGRIAQLEAGAQELDSRVKTPPADTGRQVDQRDARQETQDDRREDFIRQQPPRIQDWLRSDKGARYFTDADFARKVAAAASYAQNIKNLQIDSQAYLDYVEEQVGLRQATEPPANTGGDGRQPSTPSQGRVADVGQRMTTAPAGGASEGSVRRNSNGTIEVYLTQGEKEQARRDGITEAEYAKHKRDLIEEGLIGPGARNGR